MDLGRLQIPEYSMRLKIVWTLRGIAVMDDEIKLGDSLYTING